MLAAKFNLGSAVLQYMRGKGKKSLFCKFPVNAGNLRVVDSNLGQDDPLEEEMATHSSILAGIIAWSEEPGGLQSLKQ